MSKIGKVSELLSVVKTQGCLVVRRLLLVLFVCTYILVTYWLFWPYTPIVVKSPLTIANENKTVKAGEDLIYIMEMDKRMALPCVITKQLIDGTVKTFSPIIGNMDVGKSAYRYSVKVPLYTAPGENILRWSGAYKVNPMRWVTVVVESEPFQIIASEKQ